MPLVEAALSQRQADLDILGGDGGEVGPSLRSAASQASLAYSCRKNG